MTYIEQHEILILVRAYKKFLMITKWVLIEADETQSNTWENNGIDYLLDKHKKYFSWE